MAIAFFSATVVGYGVQHGVHGIAFGDLAPSYLVFIAVVPVLLYSFVGIELPSTAGEEMIDPKRDIPVAIAFVPDLDDENEEALLPEPAA